MIDYTEESNKSKLDHLKDGAKAVAIDGAIAYATGGSYGATAVVASIAEDKAESLLMDVVKKLKEADFEKLKSGVKNFQLLTDNIAQNNPELATDLRQKMNDTLSEISKGNKTLDNLPNVPSIRELPKQAEVQLPQKSNMDKGR